MTQPNQSEHMTQEELVKFMLNPATIDRAAKGMIERKRAKIMDDQSKPAKDIDVTRRPVDQSELRANIHSLFGDYHTVDGGYFSSYDGKWIDMTNEVVAVADYITANYTPNTEVAERERVARLYGMDRALEITLPRTMEHADSLRLQVLRDELTKAKER